MGGAIDSMEQLKIAIIDSNQIDRDNYKNYCDQSILLACTSTAISFEQFVVYHKSSETPDIILIDIEDDVVAGSNYAKKLSKLKSILPLVELIVFTRIRQENIVMKSFSAGVNGFLLKEHDSVKLEDYLISTTKGGAAITPKIARLLVQRLNYEKAHASFDLDSFSRRQLEIIDYLTDGLSIGEIAEHLNLSLKGVQYHVRVIYDKLNVRNKTELLKKYLTKNLL